MQGLTSAWYRAAQKPKIAIFSGDFMATDPDVMFPQSQPLTDQTEPLGLAGVVQSTKNMIAASSNALASGDVDAAHRSAEDAVSLIEDTEHVELWSEALSVLAAAKRASGNSIDAEEHLRHAIELRQNAGFSAKVPVAWFIGAAQLAADRRDTVLALWTYESAIEAIRAQENQGVDMNFWARDEAQVRIRMAQMFVLRAEIPQAQEQAKKAFEVLWAATQSGTDDIVLVDALFRMLVELGSLQRRCGDDEAAKASYREAIELGRDISHRSGQTIEKHRALSFALNRLAEVLMDGHDYDGALAAYAEALEIRRQLVQLMPGDKVTSKDLSSALRKVARIYHARGDVTQAYESLVESLLVDEERFQREGRSEPGILKMLASSYRQAAEWAEHDDSQALDMASRAIEAATELRILTGTHDVLRQTYLTRATIFRRLDDEALALEDEEEAAKLA